MLVFFLCRIIVFHRISYGTSLTWNISCKHPAFSLHWRHNDHDGVSNHQPHCCLLNRLFGRRSKKTWKLRVTCLCAGFHLMTSSCSCPVDLSASMVIYFKCEINRCGRMYREQICNQSLCHSAGFVTIFHVFVPVYYLQAAKNWNCSW